MNVLYLFLPIQGGVNPGRRLFDIVNRNNPHGSAQPRLLPKMRTFAYICVLYLWGFAIIPARKTSSMGPDGKTVTGLKTITHDYGTNDDVTLMTGEIENNVQKRPKRHLPEGIDSRGPRRLG